MTDKAANIRPENTAHTPRAGNGHSHEERQRQSPARTWTPSRARHGPPTEKASLTTMFDRLATAAAAHDRNAAAEIFGAQD